MCIFIVAGQEFDEKALSVQLLAVDFGRLTGDSRRRATSSRRAAQADDAAIGPFQTGWVSLAKGQNGSGRHFFRPRRVGGGELGKSQADHSKNSKDPHCTLTVALPTITALAQCASRIDLIAASC
ncbi:hypothetical protein [Rhodoblastus sp.]|uniref:hypothetical protein n=1 Tax=Rhodoblastus sp. TaxID=1962975 RepID=UPI003F9E5B75